MTPAAHRPGGTPGNRSRSPTMTRRNAYRPSQRYQVPDERHAAEDDLPSPNLVTAVVRLEAIRSPSDLVRVTGLLRDWLRRPEDDGLERAFAEWVREIAERLVPGGTKLESRMILQDVRMTLVERVSEWPRQWLREGREQGRKEGLEQGIQEGLDRVEPRSGSCCGVRRPCDSERMLLRTWRRRWRASRTRHGWPRWASGSSSAIRERSWSLT